ncbi:hypothetical protein KKF64_01010 [Patescibacteria group bacterium]|nr:hypothetical protein [Patescibacteria group bacterium]
MNIQENKLNESELEFIFELERKDIEQNLQNTAKRISENIEIPGFRKGAANYDAVCRHIGGEAKVYEEALQVIVGKALVKAVQDRKLETIGKPEISIQKMVPPFGISFKAKIALSPKIELGDISKIKIKKKEVKINEKEAKEIIERLQYEREQEEKERFEIEAIQELVKLSKISDLPNSLINEEADKMLHELEHDVSRQGIKLDDYLKSIKKTQEDLKKDFKPKAEGRIRMMLVAREFGKQENVKIDEKDVEKEIEISKKANASNPEMLAQFESDDYKNYVRNALTSRAIFERLAQKLTQ